MPSARRHPNVPLMQFLRYWLPAGIALAGVALIVVGHAAYSKTTNSHSLETATGVALLIVAVIVWMINWMYRLSIRSNLEREQEEQAREHFGRTGHWPDEEDPDSRNGVS